MNHPDFATSYQVRTNTKSGILMLIDTTANRTVVAPLTCEEAQKMADELLNAIKIFKESEATQSFMETVPANMVESQLIRN